MNRLKERGIWDDWLPLRRDAPRSPHPIDTNWVILTLGGNPLGRARLVSAFTQCFPYPGACKVAHVEEVVLNQFDMWLFGSHWSGFRTGGLPRVLPTTQLTCLLSLTFPSHRHVSWLLLPRPQPQGKQGGQEGEGSGGMVNPVSLICA